MLNSINLPPETLQTIVEDYTASDFREALSELSFLLLSSGAHLDLEPFSRPMFLVGKLHQLMGALEAEEGVGSRRGSASG